MSLGLARARAHLHGRLGWLYCFLESAAGAATRTFFAFQREARQGGREPWACICEKKEARQHLTKMTMLQSSGGAMACFFPSSLQSTTYFVCFIGSMLALALHFHDCFCRDDDGGGPPGGVRQRVGRPAGRGVLLVGPAFSGAEGGA